MAEIADLRDCALSGLFYGGRAGQKEGILINGEPWIAKYPRTTRDLVGKHLPSYTSSPVSEYLGSHIYGLLGIPVHETMLGYRAGKIVCACRDFPLRRRCRLQFCAIGWGGHFARRRARHHRDLRFAAQGAGCARALLGHVRGGRFHQKSRSQQRELGRSHDGADGL